MRRLRAVLAAFGLMAFTTPVADLPLPGTESPLAPAAEPVRITRPDWERLPSGEEMARYFPERAQRLERSGRATILCTVETDGRVSGCVVASEDPAGFGFGEAAIRLSKLFRMKPAMHDGVAVGGGQVRIPLIFSLPEDRPPRFVLNGFRAAMIVAAGLVLLLGALLLIRLLTTGSRLPDV